ncbi:MAG TPA: exodeoxyribonuclease VII large subunit [Gemmataceae bacterium]|nr:exodeoxyribonuclease VII large subunit [Gemmataceae bacterium]
MATSVNPETSTEFPFVPEGVQVQSVQQLTERVRALLEQGFGTVWVEGEIANLSRPSSGHLYFTLRDANATLSAALFRNATFRLPAGFEPKDGLEVIACGKISVYAPRGGYQLIVEKMFPKGLGAAELALRELREKLFRLGYFDAKRKKPLPRFPRTICVVSSATGAAICDMIEILGRRWPVAKVVVQPTLVQGDGAAEQIAKGIRDVNRWKERKLVHIDVIILGRGGGGAEDLSAFNTEIVAQAIYESRIPVVSAVGHEVDVTIADSVADVRASTPSHAAELTVPDRADMIDLLRDTESRIHESTRRLLLLAQRRLDELACRRGFQLPLERVRDQERRLDEIGQRAQRAIQVREAQNKQAMAALAARLEALSPLNVLARGYSLARTEATPELIRSADQVQPGDRLITTVHRGQIVSRVESVERPPDLGCDPPA